MSQNLKNSLGFAKKSCFVWSVWLVTIVFSSAACALGARPAVLDPCETIVEGSTSVEADSVVAVCELIYQGKFEAAGKLIKESGGNGQRQKQLMSRLGEIVRQYEDLSQQRRSAREAAYREQLAALEKLRTGKRSSSAEDANDVTDANDIPGVLLVVTKACEFADSGQKKELMSDAFVKQTIQKALDKAGDLEAEGKWLESYTNCYYWLQAIEPNNQSYSDYAEQLLDKAAILASFQDSPCETSEERYEGVSKGIFLKSIDYLDAHYVDIIDYREMATKAVNRCKLLADVLEVSPLPDSGKQDVASGEKTGDEKPGDAQEAGDGEPDKAVVPAPDKRRLAAFSSALAALLDEAGKSPTGYNKNQFKELFENVLAVNTATAELPQAVLISHFSEAALSALDPYTVIVWPKSVKDFEKMMTKEFTGIGVEINKQKGMLTVASLLPDTPAYKSGLDAGDVIEAVDGLETKDMTLMCAVHKITGPKGTKVTLRVRSPREEKPREITIVRDRIIVPTIRGWQRTEAGKWLFMIDDQDEIGYVRITDFTGDTASRLEKALSELEGKGLKGLILDLRFNLGGLLDSAVAVSDKFLKKDLIVRIEPRAGFGRWPTYEEAHSKGTHPDYPVVILINSTSASASEIVAGALADKKHERALLVGERTHGKGRVQGITPFPGGGAQLKYTMAYYHLPSGQRVESRDAMKKVGRDDWGVGPDVEIRLRSDELRKMIDVQRDNDVLVRGDREQKKHAIEESIESDPQLAVGLMVIRSKLIEAQVR
ncbi:MAG: S41 family peptidase [Phycisphaerales bacterium]|nr:MAG: S41 family peptidase [Phycisphaerales bacterium]